MPDLAAEALDTKVPPSYCEYACGPCDQNFLGMLPSSSLFLFSQHPSEISSTIESSVEKLQTMLSSKRWITWKNLDVPGQIIFCEICKAMRYTDLVVADVTTLNFNLMFEIGFAIGLGLPVLPIRNTKFIEDKHQFDELGILDTLGYFDFQTSNDLKDYLIENPMRPRLQINVPALNNESPLYVVKAPVDSDGTIKMLSVIKKSRLRFRLLDTRETGRVSLHEVYKNALCSRAIFIHLLNASYQNAKVHNARCAFIAGLGMATGKRVVMLQQHQQPQPIDYRDVVLTYSHPRKIHEMLVPALGEVIEQIQTMRFVPTALPITQLEKLDLGDLAAENEIKALDSYFIPTAQYQRTKQGHARLVVGRKGTGKSALFYSLRSTFRPLKSHLVLDLRPEGHQLVKLREFVLAGLSGGYQQHLLTAFWNYLLIVEIAYQIAKQERTSHYRDARLRYAFDLIAAEFPEETDEEQADFSERLLRLVNEVTERRSQMAEPRSNADITQLVYSRQIRELVEALTEYLSLSRRSVWILIDNLDKGWPIHSVLPEDIFILRSLLEATRKLERQFESRGVGLHSVVFIRNDIYQHLILEPAERGKETAALLDWNDSEVFKQLLARRLSSGLDGDMDFDTLWAQFFPSHVHGEESFQFILNRTLMRPRELLRFVRECIDVGLNRQRQKLNEDDILQAEEHYSSDALVDVCLEMRDVNAKFGDVPYAFIGSTTVLSKTDVTKRLENSGIQPEEIGYAIDILLWFSVLGIYLDDEEERFSYQYEHNTNMLTAGVSHYAYCIHPAFRAALGCSNNE
jgi:hypothetical protein